MSGHGRSSLLLLFAALAFVGCGEPRAAPVDPGLARDTLGRVLDAWKGGGRPEDLQKETPSVVVQDLEWQGGATLVGYEILASGEALDANLHCPVRLIVRDAAGRESTKNVTYIVGTDPMLTVFRQIF